jgi:hypothetical protein
MMMWLVSKFEHVCKVMARSWIANSSAAAAGGRAREGAQDSHGAAAPPEAPTVSVLCNTFTEQCSDGVDALVGGFLHGFLHVLRSLREYKGLPDSEIVPPS